MTLRLLADASAQTTVSGTITNVATSIAAVSTANFPAPAANQVARLIILDSGNGAFSASNPLATNFEYCDYTTNTVGTNTISGITRGVAGTTAKAYSAGATIAVPWLAEDVVASAPWKFDDQRPTGASGTILIPASGSIPASYLGISWNYLRIHWRLRTTSANVFDNLLLQINGDVAAHYDYQNGAFSGSGGGATTNANVSQTTALLAQIAGGTSAANTFSTGWIEFGGYSDTVATKSWLGHTYQGTSNPPAFWTFGGKWQSTAAITSISLEASAGNWATGSYAITELGP